MRLLLVLFTVLFVLQSPKAQELYSDSLWSLDIPEFVVTATRSGRMLGNVTVPTLLLQAKTIRMAGNIRLNEVLQEQTGLFLSAGSGSGAVGGGVFGNGIQIQGLSPDHTLILLDGEPLIGRQGGIIDLSRFTVGNIRKIEIVKGPSSALYGSEAMGGVVNILTEHKRGNYSSGGLRYGQFQTLDAFASTQISKGKSSLYLFGNYNSSEGYDLQPELPERTLDPYHNVTAQARWIYRFSEQTRLNWNNRFFRGVQDSKFAMNSEILNTEGQGITTDININPTIDHRFSEALKTSMRLYGSYFLFNQQLNQMGSDQPYYSDNFQHLFLRLENQTDWDWAEGKQLVAGGGYNIQQVETIRYRNTQTQHIGYAFLQQEWRPNSHWTFIPGLRYDVHSDYANRLSPKFSLQYKANQRLNINASYGSGFKAPDFRQLYLYYVNPAAQGYRVYGASEFSVADMEQELQDGLISRILPTAYDIRELRPEISHGFNLGGNYTFKNAPLKADVNVFFNAVRDLINYLPVAFTNTNSLVFSYMNIRSAYTGGVEFNLQGSIKKQLEWSAGYQYLITGDQDVVRGIRRGEVFGRNSLQGSTRRMSMADYSGLLGRSPHMANARLFYEHANTGWGGSLRAIYRSRWGVLDLDGNGFANMPDEFAKGFVMLHASVQKTYGESLTLQLNLNNLLNHLDPMNLPNIPGTHIMGSVFWNFSH